MTRAPLRFHRRKYIFLISIYSARREGNISTLFRIRPRLSDIGPLNEPSSICSLDKIWSSLYIELVTNMTDQRSINIIRARSIEDLEAAAVLFAEYGKSLDLDLAFQDFETEVKALPGKYASPGGDILLARDANGNVIGCVALRPLTPLVCCEMKRLYILPTGRGMGIGKKLVNAVVEIAGSLGYQEIKLDTLPSMGNAISLYTRSGFVPTAPYYDTPLSGTVFLVRQLLATYLHDSSRTSG